MRAFDPNSSILRSDTDYALRKGAICEFSKAGDNLLVEKAPIWLTRNDWAALAEIRVATQLCQGDRVSGSFVVLHVYGQIDQGQMTEMFRRMYGSSGDPYIYILIAGDEYERSLTSGTLYQDSLMTAGFIHAAPVDQLTRIANKYHRKTVDLRVMVIDTAKILAPVRWEPGPECLYPHIYGPLNMSATVRAVAVTSGVNGEYDIMAADLE
jgi:uncharacterized protein (DUF952 family)